ncbi:unnamed protein product [Lampetra planeri]
MKQKKYLLRRPTALVARAPSARSDDVLQSAQECMANPAQLPPPQSWLDIDGHLWRLMSAAAHLLREDDCSNFHWTPSGASCRCHD